MDAEFKRMDRRMAEGFSEQMNVTLMLFGSLIMLIALFAYNRVGPPHGGQAPGAETRCGRGKDHQARTGLAARPRPRQPGRPKLTRLIQVLAGRDQPLAADLKHAALLCCCWLPSVFGSRFPPRIVRMNTGRFVPHP